MQKGGRQGFGARVVIAIAAAVIVGLYQNCGRNTADSALAPQAPQDQISSRDITSNVPSFQKEAGPCQPEQLRCLRKVYSPLEENRQVVEQACVEPNGPCFNLNAVYYNTTFALQECKSCGPEASRPGGEYHREEVTCWVEEAGNPEPTSYALRADFNSAASSALATCGGSLQ